MRVIARKETDTMIVDIKRPELGLMDLRVEALRDRGRVRLVATRRATPDDARTIVSWSRTFIVQAACRMCSVLTGSRLRARLYDVELNECALEREVPEGTTTTVVQYEFRMSDITPDGRRLLFTLNADEAAALSLALQAAIQKAMEALP